MSDALREALSAVMDGEGDELSLRRVLARCEEDEVRDTWARYHLARDAMQDRAVRLSPDLSGAVRRAIDAEGGARRGAGSRGGAWRAVTSFAVAASVTAAVVLGGRELAGVGDPAASKSSPVGLVNSIGATPVRASYGTRALPVLEPATATAYEELARQRMRQYSQEHAEHASLNTPQGLIPFARVPELDR